MPVPGDYEHGVKSANGSPRSGEAGPPRDPGTKLSPDPYPDPYPDAHLDGSEDLFPVEEPEPPGVSTRRSDGRRPAGHAVERARGWIGDRLPEPLKGRWRMDHRVGTVLSAVAVAGGITMGGYALWTAQPGDQPPQYSVTRSADQGFDGADRESGKRSGDSDGSSASRGSDQDGDYSRGGRAQTPQAEPGPDDDPDDGSAMSGSMPVPGQEPAASGGPGIMVDVEGKVLRPGVQRLPAGARVLDALTMAGGALPGTDLSNLDQARVLGDGEQIMVGPGAGAGPPIGAGPSAPAAKGRTKAVPTSPIHLNTATLDQLEQLPGVGPALAQRVLDWRTEHGRFASVADLQQVKGFGPHKFGAVHDLVTP